MECSKCGYIYNGVENISNCPKCGQNFGLKEEEGLSKKSKAAVAVGAAAGAVAGIANLAAKEGKIFASSKEDKKSQGEHEVEEEIFSETNDGSSNDENTQVSPENSNAQNESTMGSVGTGSNPNDEIDIDDTVETPVPTPGKGNDEHEPESNPNEGNDDGKSDDSINEDTPSDGEDSNNDSSNEDTPSNGEDSNNDSSNEDTPSDGEDSNNDSSNEDTPSDGEDSNNDSSNEDTPSDGEDSNNDSSNENTSNNGDDDKDDSIDVEIPKDEGNEDTPENDETQNNGNSPSQGNGNTPSTSPSRPSQPSTNKPSSNQSNTDSESENTKPSNTPVTDFLNDNNGVTMSLSSDGNSYGSDLDVSLPDVESVLAKLGSSKSLMSVSSGQSYGEVFKANGSEYTDVLGVIDAIVEKSSSLSKYVSPFPASAAQKIKSILGGGGSSGYAEELVGKVENLKGLLEKLYDNYELSYNMELQEKLYETNEAGESSKSASWYELQRMGINVNNLDEESYAFTTSYFENEMKNLNQDNYKNSYLYKQLNNPTMDLQSILKLYEQYSDEMSLAMISMSAAGILNMDTTYGNTGETLDDFTYKSASTGIFDIGKSQTQRDLEEKLAGNIDNGGLTDGKKEFIDNLGKHTQNVNNMNHQLKNNPDSKQVYDSIKGEYVEVTDETFAMIVEYEAAWSKQIIEKTTYNLCYTDTFDVVDANGNPTGETQTFEGMLAFKGQNPRSAGENLAVPARSETADYFMNMYFDLVGDNSTDRLKNGGTFAESLWYNQQLYDIQMPAWEDAVNSYTDAINGGLDGLAQQYGIKSPDDISPEALEYIKNSGTIFNEDGTYKPGLNEDDLTLAYLKYQSTKQLDEYTKFNNDMAIFTEFQNQLANELGTENVNFKSGALNEYLNYINDKNRDATKYLSENNPKLPEGIDGKALNDRLNENFEFNERTNLSYENSYKYAISVEMGKVNEEKWGHWTDIIFNAFAMYGAAESGNYELSSELANNQMESWNSIQNCKDRNASLNDIAVKTELKKEDLMYNLNTTIIPRYSDYELLSKQLTITKSLNEEDIRKEIVENIPQGEMTDAEYKKFIEDSVDYRLAVNLMEQSIKDQNIDISQYSEAVQHYYQDLQFYAQNKSPQELEQILTSMNYSFNKSSNRGDLKSAYESYNTMFGYLDSAGFELEAQRQAKEILENESLKVKEYYDDLYASGQISDEQYIDGYQIYMLRSAAEKVKENYVLPFAAGVKSFGKGLEHAVSNSIEYLAIDCGLKEMYAGILENNPSLANMEGMELATFFANYEKPAHFQSMDDAKWGYIMSEVNAGTYGHNKLDYVAMQACQSIGNMAIPMVVSAFCQPAGSALLATSAYGNTFESCRVDGMNPHAALIYSVLSAGSEMILEKKLGGMPFMSEASNAAGIPGYFKSMYSEAVEEMVQEFIDPFLEDTAYAITGIGDLLVHGEFTLEDQGFLDLVVNPGKYVGNYLENDFDAKAMLEAGIVAMYSAGLTNGGKLARGVKSKIQYGDSTVIDNRNAAIAQYASEHNLPVKAVKQFLKQNETDIESLVENTKELEQKIKSSESKMDEYTILATIAHGDKSLEKFNDLIIEESKKSFKTNSENNINNDYTSGFNIFKDKSDSIDILNEEISEKSAEESETKSNVDGSEDIRQYSNADKTIDLLDAIQRLLQTISVDEIMENLEQSELEKTKDRLSEKEGTPIRDLLMQLEMTRQINPTQQQLISILENLKSNKLDIIKEFIKSALSSEEKEKLEEEMAALEQQQKNVEQEIVESRQNLKNQVRENISKIEAIKEQLNEINEKINSETDPDAKTELENKKTSLEENLNQLNEQNTNINEQLDSMNVPDLESTVEALENKLDDLKNQESQFDENTPDSVRQENKTQQEQIQSDINRTKKDLVNLLHDTNNKMIDGLNEINSNKSPDTATGPRVTKLQEGVVKQITENQRKIQELQKQGIHPNGSIHKMSPETKAVVNNVNTMNNIVDTGTEILNSLSTDGTSNSVSTAVVGTSTNQVAANVDTMNNIVGTGNAIVGVASGGATVGALIGGIKSGILDLETKIKNFDKNGNNLNENEDGTRDTRTRRELKKELHEKRQMLGKIENSLHEYSMTENSPLKEFLDQMNSEIRDMELGKFDSEKVAEAYEVNIATMNDKTAAQLKAQVTEFIKAINSINYSNMTFDQKLNEKFTDVQTLFDTLMNKIDFTESLSAVESIVKTLDIDASSQTEINSKLAELTDALTDLETNIREYNTSFDSSKLTEIKKAFNTINVQIERLNTELSNSLSVLTNNYGNLAINIETSGVSAMTAENVKSISDLLSVVYESINGTYSYFDSLTKLTEITDMSKNHLKYMNVFKVSNEFNELVNKFKNGDIDFDEFKVKLNNFSSGFNTVMNTYYSIDSTAFETVEPNTIVKNQTSIKDVFSSITTSNLSEAFELLKKQIGTVFVDSDAKKFEFITGLNELEKSFKHLLENTSTESVNTSNVTELKSKLDDIVSNLTKHINNNAKNIKVTEVNGTLVVETTNNINSIDTKVEESIETATEQVTETTAENVSDIEQLDTNNLENNISELEVESSSTMETLDVPNFENVDSSIEEMSVPEIEESQNVETVENVEQTSTDTIKIDDSNFKGHFGEMVADGSLLYHPWDTKLDALKNKVGFADISNSLKLSAIAALNECHQNMSQGMTEAELMKLFNETALKDIISLSEFADAMILAPNQQLDANVYNEIVNKATDTSKVVQENVEIKEVEKLSTEDIVESKEVESETNEFKQPEVTTEEVKVETEAVNVEQKVVTVEELKNEVLDLVLNAEDTDVAFETFAKKITDMLETDRTIVKEFFNAEGIKALKLNILAKCDYKTVETICEQLLTYKSAQEVFTIALNADYVNSITKTEGFNQILWSTGLKVINRVKLLYIAKPAVMNILKSIAQNNTAFTNASTVNDYLSIITNQMGHAKQRLYQENDVDLDRVVEITDKLNARVYLTHSINKVAIDLIINQFISNINSPQIPAMLKNCLETIEFHDAKNPHDYYWSTQYGAKNILVSFLSAATGGYGSFTSWALSPATLGTVSHELGHSFDTKYAEMLGYSSSYYSKVNPAWQQAIEADGKNISSYGKNSFSEDFAETMSMFVTNRTKLQKQFPNRYNQLISMMREYASYTLDINNVTDMTSLRELMINNGIDAQIADNIINSGHSIENIKTALVDYVAFTDDIQTTLETIKDTQVLTTESVKTMNVEDIIKLANSDLDSIPTIMKSGNYEFLQNPDLSNEAFAQAIEYMKSENRLSEITNISIDVGTNIQKAFIGFMNNLHIKTDSSIDLELQAKLLSDVMLNPNSQISDIKMVSGFLTSMGYIKSEITVSDLSVAKNLLDAGYANIVPTSNIYARYSQLVQQKIATTYTYETKQIINQLVANESKLIGELINSKNISVVQGLMRHFSQFTIDGMDIVFSQLDASSVPNITKLLFDGISKYSDGTPYLAISEQRMKDIVGITNPNVRDYVIKKTFEVLLAEVGYDFNNSQIIKEIAKSFGNGFTPKDAYWGLALSYKQAKSNLYRHAIGLRAGDVVNNAGVNVRVYEYGTNRIMKKYLSEFNKAFNQLPPVYKNCAQYMGLHAEICELNIVETIKNNGIPTPGQFYGYNFSGTRQIELFNGQVGLWNIAHEIGHIFDSEYSDLLAGVRSNAISYNPFSETGVWSNAIEQDALLSQNRYNPFGKYVSQYGKDSVEVTHVGFKEDFCDSMAKFFTDRNRFLEQFPNRAKVIISMMYDFTSMKYDKYLTTEQGLRDLLQLFNEDPSQIDELLKNYSFEATRDAVIEHITFGSEMNPNLDTMRDLATQLGTTNSTRAIYNFNIPDTEITAPLNGVVEAVNTETTVNAGYVSNIPSQVSNLNDVIDVINAMGRNPQNIIDAYIQTGNINLFTRASGVRDFVSQYTVSEFESMVRGQNPRNSQNISRTSNKAERLTQFDYVEFEMRKGNYAVLNDSKLSYDTLRQAIVYLAQTGRVEVLNQVGLHVTDKRIVNGLIGLGVNNFTVSPELYDFTIAKFMSEYSISDMASLLETFLKTNNPIINAMFNSKVCSIEDMLRILNKVSKETLDEVSSKYFTFDYKLQLFEKLDYYNFEWLFNVDENVDPVAHRNANIFFNKLLSDISNELISKIKVREFIPFLPNSIVNKIRMSSPSKYVNKSDNEVIKVVTDAKSVAEYELIKIGYGMSTRPVNFNGVEVRFFANNKEAHQNLLRKFDKFKNIYNSLPSTFRDCLTQMNFLDMSDPDNDSYSIDTHGNILFRFTAVGTGGNGKFYLWNNGITTNLMAHEIAHSLDTEYANMKLGRKGYYTELNNSWQQAVESDNRRVTEYGDTSLQEDFAESVAIYMEHRESFARKYPHRTAQIEAMLRDLTVMKNGLDGITIMRDMANKLIECKVPKAQILDLMQQGYNVEQLKKALIDHLALGKDMYDAIGTKTNASNTIAYNTIDIRPYESQINSIFESMAARHQSYDIARQKLEGYIKSGNPNLITSYNGARSAILSIPRDVLNEYVEIKFYNENQSLIQAATSYNRTHQSYKSQKSMFSPLENILSNALNAFRDVTGKININTAESQGTVLIDRNPGKAPYGLSEKNWINSADGDVIFKQTTENESFAEVIGYEIAKSIDLSSAKYDFATMDGKNGVVSYSIEQDGFEFKRANQLLSEANQSYSAIVHKFESIANADVETSSLDVKKYTIKDLIELSKILKLEESSLFETIDVETITEYNFGTIYTDLTSAINTKINEYSTTLDRFNTNQINVSDITILVEMLVNTTDMNINKESAVTELTKMFIFDSVLYPGFRPLGDWGMMYNKTTGELTFAPLYDNSSIGGLDGTVSTISNERLDMLKDLISKSDSQTISMIKDTLSKFNIEEINKIFEQIESQYGKQIPSEIRTTVVQSIETNMERINQLFEDNSSNGNSSPGSSSKIEIIEVADPAKYKLSDLFAMDNRDKIQFKVGEELLSYDDFTTKVALSQGLMSTNENILLELNNAIRELTEDVFEKTGKTLKEYAESVKPTNKAQLTQLDLNAQTEAQRILDKAIIKEAEITKDIELLQEKGAYLTGLKHKLKTLDSLTRKIVSDYKKYAKRNEPKPLEYFADAIGDSVRYTLIFDESNYVNGVNECIKELEGKGYKFLKIKNFWDAPHYKGINTSILAPNGQVFELQFHTELSFVTKETLTHMYFEIKRSAIDEDMKNKADAVQIVLQKNVMIPNDANNIEPIEIEIVKDLNDYNLKLLEEYKNPEIMTFEYNDRSFSFSEFKSLLEENISTKLPDLNALPTQNKKSILNVDIKQSFDSRTAQELLQKAMSVFRNAFGRVDIGDAEENGIVTIDKNPSNANGGAREKNWVKNNIGSFLFKKTHDINYENFGEILGYEFAKLIGLDCAKYELATLDGTDGVITYNIVGKNEKLISGKEILDDVSQLYIEPLRELISNYNNLIQQFKSQDVSVEAKQLLIKNLVELYNNSITKADNMTKYVNSIDLNNINDENFDLILNEFNKYYEDLSSMYEYDFKQWNKKKSVVVSNNLYDIWNLIDKYCDIKGYTIAADQNIIADLLKMTVYDLILNQGDRHISNWSILLDNNTKTIRFAPIYDNSNICNLNQEKEKIAEKVHAFEKFEKEKERMNETKYNRTLEFLSKQLNANDSKIMIDFDDNRIKNNKLDMFEKLLKTSDIETVRMIKQICNQFNLENVDLLFDNFANEYGTDLPSDVKAIVRKTIEMNMEKINELLEEVDSSSNSTPTTSNVDDFIVSSIQSNSVNDNKDLVLAGNVGTQNLFNYGEYIDRFINKHSLNLDQKFIDDFVSQGDSVIIDKIVELLNNMGNSKLNIDVVLKAFFGNGKFTVSSKTHLDSDAKTSFESFLTSIFDIINNKYETKPNLMLEFKLKFYKIFEKLLVSNSSYTLKEAFPELVDLYVKNVLASSLNLDTSFDLSKMINKEIVTYLSATQNNHGKHSIFDFTNSETDINLLRDILFNGRKNIFLELVNEKVISSIGKINSIKNDDIKLREFLSRFNYFHYNRNAQIRDLAIEALIYEYNIDRNLAVKVYDEILSTGLIDKFEFPNVDAENKKEIFENYVEKFELENIINAKKKIISDILSELKFDFLTINENYMNFISSRIFVDVSQFTSDYLTKYPEYYNIINELTIDFLLQNPQYNIMDKIEFNNYIHNYLKNKYVLNNSYQLNFRNYKHIEAFDFDSNNIEFIQDPIVFPESCSSYFDCNEYFLSNAVLVNIDGTQYTFNDLKKQFESAAGTQKEDIAKNIFKIQQQLEALIFLNLNKLGYNLVNNGNIYYFEKDGFKISFKSLDHLLRYNKKDGGAHKNGVIMFPYSIENNTLSGRLFYDNMPVIKGGKEVEKTFWPNSISIDRLLYNAAYIYSKGFINNNIIKVLANSNDDNMMYYQLESRSLLSNDKIGAQLFSSNQKDVKIYSCVSKDGILVTFYAAIN